MPDETALPLSGLRVLVVEDEFLLALSLEQDLQGAGCTVVGPYHRLDSAIAAARGERFDLAVLDVNLNGVPIFPLADELHRRGVPFLFLSGYGSANLPPEFRDLPRVGKPYETAALLEAIESVSAAFAPRAVTGTDS